MTTLSNNIFPDLDLISSGPNLLPPLRLSPTALSEIIETFQRIQSKKDISLFGTLMGSVNSQGEYLVSSVVCLHYELNVEKDDSKLNIQVANNYTNIIESHQQMYNCKCLGAFLVNSKSNDMLEGIIIEITTSYMRSKMESQLADLLLKINLDPSSADYKLNAFVILPNKYFIASFANMSEIPVKIDYIPEIDRHVHQNLIFYQMARSNIKNLESQTLDKLIKILDGSIQDQEDEIGISEENSSPEQVVLNSKLLGQLNEIFKCRQRIDMEDLELIKKEFNDQKDEYEVLMKVLQEQMEVAKKLALDNSSKK